MLRYFLFSFLLLSAFVNAEGQGMKDIFLSAPDSIFPTMTSNNRLDLVDFNSSNMTARVISRLSAEIYLDSLSSDYLKLREASHEMELGLFPVNDSIKVLAAVDKVLTPATDSRIRYFNLDWTRYEGEGFIRGTNTGIHSLRVRDFLSISVEALSVEQVEILRRLEDVALYDANLDVHGKCLVVGVSTGRLNQEERKKVSAMFEKKSFPWPY